MQFFCFLLIIVVAEISVMIWAYANSHKLEEYVRETVKSTVQEEYGVVDSRTRTFDTIQEGLMCCGANGPRDWASSKYNKADRNVLDLAVSSTLQVYKVPESCCNPHAPRDVCKTARSVSGISAALTDIIHSEVSAV